MRIINIVHVYLLALICPPLRPHTEPNDVIVTGSFDNVRIIHVGTLCKFTDDEVHSGARLFTLLEAILDLRAKSLSLGAPRSSTNSASMETGLVLEDQPTEIDPIGNVNNLAYAPEKPVTAHAIKAARSEVPSSSTRTRRSPRTQCPHPPQSRQVCRKVEMRGRGMSTPSLSPCSWTRFWKRKCVFGILLLSKQLSHYPTCHF